MAEYSGNDVYLAIDGFVQTMRWIEISLEPSIGSVEVTSGGAATHVKRNTTLRDNTGTIVLHYDDVDFATYVLRLQPGIHTIDFGPERNISGKPRHTQEIIVTKAPLKITVKKDPVVIALSYEQRAAPTNDMFAGAVWL